MKVPPSEIAYEQQYSDKSGVECRITFISQVRVLGIEGCGSRVSISLDETCGTTIQWMIDCLNQIKEIDEEFVTPA
jgi:hypothetical protein